MPAPPPGSEEDRGRRADQAAREACCKGSWVLGTACGRCLKCRDEAARLLPGVMEEARLAGERLAAIQGVMPPNIAGFEVGEKFKVACYDEVRRLLTAKPTR